jgi:hypothetical protein
MHRRRWALTQLQLNPFSIGRCGLQHNMRVLRYHNVGLPFMGKAASAICITVLCKHEPGHPATTY